jgi:hypothetical protein
VLLLLLLLLLRPSHLEVHSLLHCPLLLLKS